MIALLLMLSFAQAEPISTRCLFKSVCATRGRCDDDGKTCGTRTQAACDASEMCVKYGDCLLAEGKSFCRGEDSAACGPDSAPCRLYGNCKAGKPGQFFCGPTKDGCKNSEACKVDGLCGMGLAEDGLRPMCLPTAAGCKASYGCIERGDCKAGRWDCGHDPRACTGTRRCREFGSCTSTGMICTRLSDADCAAGRQCSVYGKCVQRIQVCDPRDLSCAPYSCAPAGDCSATEICKRYGACHATIDRCRVQPEAPTCTTHAVAIASVVASSTGRGTGADLIDGRPESGWTPSPEAPLPHRLTLKLARSERVAGVRIAQGLHRIDPVEGVLAHAYGVPRGVVVRIGEAVHEVFETVSTLEWQTLDFAPVATDAIVLEVFDSLPGKLHATYGVSELEILACD